jgi:hypothetical protein
VGLAPKPEYLNEIDGNYAEKVIETILWKDLAYGVEIMPKDKAQRYAKEFLKEFYNYECQLYTNGDWKNYHEKSSTVCSPLTSATFDAGVLVVHPKYLVSIWVRDED